MRLKLQNLRLLDVRQILAVAVAALIFCTLLAGLLNGQKAGAATASTINFQARLMNDDGSIAPDGNYNIEFKLYDTASTGGTAQGVCTGNCKWVETRTSGNTVTVANGYVTVNLGSVTSFGSTINWDQDLWMTMNVGGTGSPSWDGEMTPRLKLTAVPYAFRAAQLSRLAGSFTGTLELAASFGQNTVITLPDPISGTATVCYQGASSCGFATGSGSAFVQGGNSFSTTATLGTNDNNDLVFERFNSTRVTIGANDVALATDIDLLLQGANAYVSNPQAQTNSEAFGLNAAVSDQDALAVGNGATAQNSRSIALGRLADAAGDDGIALGNQAQVTSNSGIAIGSTATAGFDGIALGYGASATFSESIALGALAEAKAANQLVIGGPSSNTSNINHVVIGSGVTDATPVGFTLEATGGEGSDVAGASISIAGGRGTGTGNGGGINFQIAKPAGSTGSAANSLSTVVSLSGADGSVLFKNAANSTTALRVQNATASSTLLRVDTSNNRVYVGDAAASTGADSTLFVVDSATTANAPSGVDGGMFYDTSLGKFRCYQGGWLDCINTAAGGVSTVGAFSGSSQTNGANITGTTITFGPADGTNPGMVSTSAQTFAGDKTFSGNVIVQGTTGLTFNTGAGGDITFANGEKIDNDTDGTLNLQANSGALTLLLTGTAANITNSAGTLTLNSFNNTLTVDSSDTTFTTGFTTVTLGTNTSINSAGTITLDSGSNVIIPNADSLQSDDVTSTSSLTLTTAAASNLVFNTGGTVRGTFDTSNSLYLGNGLTAASPNNFTIRGTGSTTTAVAGGSLTIQGGNATVGTANGGNVTLTGGTGFGTGVRGLVVIDTPTITTASTQNCSSNCSVTQANIDSNGVVLINATNPSLTVTLSDPTILTAGRLMYVTNVGSNDFTLSVNGGGTGNTIAMKPNTTATMIWNGTDWTAAGASSSTDLQSAYNNTLTSAGGAELVLNAPGGSADGLTIRNNATTPIVGGILEVQTSIGSNLLTVNNNATEYATNGGAETAGASSSTFPSSTWDTTTGGTVDRWTTAGDNIATGQASVRVQTTTTNHGARNRISASLTSGLTYTVSFAVRGAANFTTLQVLYSPDGTTTGTTQCATAQTVTAGIWTRISCTFIASGTITSSNSILIRQTDATARTFYIDNLSVNVNASATFAADGSVDVALGSNWTAFGTLDSLTRETSTIYDTSGSVNVNTPNSTDRGVRNNLAITPAVSTQYLVTFYARSSNTFNDIRVRYSRDGGTNFVSCVDYNTQSVSTSTFVKITCLFTTDSTTPSNADLIIDQPTASDRNFYIDALTITLNTNNSNNVQVGGGNKGGPATLFTLDRSNSAPIAANNEAYLGSMYYDTTSGRIQCYEADGWGACGAAPDNIVNLNPEYAGAVLNGSGIGTMTADFCANQSSVLQVNYATSTDPCFTSGDVKNYYKWTSPQSTQQTYSIYVTYQLPATFNGFSSDDTVQLTGRVTDTANAAVTYQMYYKTPAGSLTQCWDSVTAETTVATSNNTWQSVGVNGNEATGCSLSASAANGFIIFKINMKAKSNASAFASTLSFTTTGR